VIFNGADVDFCNLVLLPVSLIALLVLSGCSRVNTTNAKAPSSSEKETAVPVQVFIVKSRELRRAVDAVGSLFAGTLYAMGVAVPFIVACVAGVVFSVLAVPGLRAAGGRLAAPSAPNLR